jgi:hypothetical protein
MSTYNIHWYALGTGPRYKKTNGQYTGMMWGKRGMIPQPVRLGWLKSKGKAKKVMIDQMQRKFIENIKKKIKTKGFRKTLGV